MGRSACQDSLDCSRIRVPAEELYCLLEAVHKVLGGLFSIHTNGKELHNMLVLNVWMQKVFQEEVLHHDCPKRI